MLLPLAGIGVCVKEKSSRPPCFLTVKNLEENEKGVQFDFHFIAKIEGVPSFRFLRELGGQGLFFSIPPDRILDVFNKLGVKPPQEWRMLLEEESPSSWLDWVGKRFQL